MRQTWEQAQKWEKDWQGNCVNRVAGELNHVQNIAPKMGLKLSSNYSVDLKGIRVLDIGGGSVSILLQCTNVKGKVVDPLKYPDWVYARYDCAGIEWEIKKGEDIDEIGYDEVWIYNCLQHTENPKKIVENAKKAGKLIRMYEWVDIPVSDGHIHTLRENELNEWLGGEGRVELNDKGFKRYFGIFPTNVNTKEYWNDIHRRDGKDTWRVKDELNDYVLSKVKGSVLELGCGVGVFARKVKDKYLGLDISPVAVRIMKEQGFNAEVRNIPPINTGKFDTIVGLEFLEHIDDRLKVIKEASKLCQQAIFSVPDDCMPPEEIAEHRVMFNKESFKKFLEKAFENVEIVSIDKYLVGVCK